MSAFEQRRFYREQFPLYGKLWQINWTLVLLVCTLCGIGFLTLYSAGDGTMRWVLPQLTRFAAGFFIMIITALIDIRFWMKYSYPLYFLALLLLIAVSFFGTIGMGAQRWLDLGIFRLQPSEVMKITLVMALARYFHGASYQDVGRPLYLIPPLILVFAPAVLVMKQPDLGTAMMLIMSGGVTFFLVGVRLWKFLVLICSVVITLPIAWEFLAEYQKDRVRIFLNPEVDPSGRGYHIIQSKIALGSGGLFGKGYMEGPQSHLDFLPEKHTDFIFTMLAEEWGMIGGLVLLGIYLLVIIYCTAIALQCHNRFGRLVAMGMTANFFLYIFINTAMVMGLVPVVGVPLPLISYGGTSLLTLQFGFGLIMCAYVHRETLISRRANEI